MKKLFISLFAAALFMPAFAEGDSEFSSEEKLESGFLTSMANDAIEKALTNMDDDYKFGRTVTKFASAPKFGGYYIGKYSYSDQDGKHGGDGFTQRLIRVYVDGTIYKDFKYRVQAQLNNQAFHMKDVYVEWVKYKAFQIKVGQYKRAFGFENPMNPWDISTGDYSLMTKKFTGHGDYLTGEAASNGGRDQGVQVQGDFLKVGKDNHYLFHYQIGAWNGQGINTADLDGKKDIIGTFQVQPIKNLFIGFFGWHGTYVKDNINYERNRYILGAKWEESGYTLRGEYAHGAASQGKSAADGWYVTGGMPICDWFRLNAQYQCFRDTKSWAGSQNVYSLIPEFWIHKNLKLQIQYNYNNNRKLGDNANYNELWAEFYFRF